MKFQLTDERQAKALMTGLWPKVLKALQAGKQLTLEIKETNKSREQEEKYHAMIGEIAKQASHLGAKWDAEDFKRLLVHQFAKETGRDKNTKVVPSLDGLSIVQLGLQTRKFTKEDGNEFIEWLYAWCANNGVDIK